MYPQSKWSPCSWWYNCIWPLSSASVLSLLLQCYSQLKYTCSHINTLAQHSCSFPHSQVSHPNICTCNQALMLVHLFQANHFCPCHNYYAILFLLTSTHQSVVCMHNNNNNYRVNSCTCRDIHYVSECVYCVQICNVWIKNAIEVRWFHVFH